MNTGSCAKIQIKCLLLLVKAGGLAVLHFTSYNMYVYIIFSYCSIYPSPEQESGIHISVASNTGSLPDLTNLHFPSPLTTPLDVEDQTYKQQGRGALSLSPTGHSAAMGGGQQTSPSFRRRHPEGGPSPLVINSGSPTQMRHGLPNQVHVYYFCRNYVLN